MPPTPDNCTHARVSCINPYELIRKYECDDCGGMMMCACDEPYARKHLPHQIIQGKRLKTQERVPVTLGFQRHVCNACRGIPEEPAPKAAIHGRTSKVQRYYWREIAIRSTEQFSRWADENGIPHKPLLHLTPEYRDVYKQIHKDVTKAISDEHAKSPKYQYQVKSADDVLRGTATEVIELSATYVNNASKGHTIVLGPSVVSVEDFVTQHFRSFGFDVLKTESIPMHVLFATLMFIVVCDVRDPRARMAAFADRYAFDRGERGEKVWVNLPSDFGTSEYGERRKKAIEQQLSMIGPSREMLLMAFDIGFESSESLRQYLWAHKPERADVARKLITILPPEHVVSILRYLASNYWHHYLGWPDLVVYNADGYFFVEVKGSGDKISEDQKRWLELNHIELHFPFKLVKVVRAATVDRPS